MEKRTIEKVVDILIVITSVTGLLFLFGVINADTVSFAQMDQIMTVLTIFACIYYFLEAIWIQKKREGIFFALIKFILLTSITFCTIFGWIFMTPFYALEADNVQIAYMFLHILIPLLIVIEWIISEKGHFNRKFIVTYMFLVILYLICILLIPSITEIAYPYAFFNPQQLGYKIVLEECVIILVILFFYAKSILWLDRKFRKKRKKKRYDL